MRATEHSFVLTVSDAVAKMKVECYLADVEGGTWLQVDAPVGCEKWPLFPTAVSLKDELEEKFSFYVGKSISLYRALHVNGKVQRDGEAFGDDWAINQNAAKYGVYVQVDTFVPPEGGGPQACNMRGAAAGCVVGDGAYIEVYIVDEKFKGWQRVEVVSDPTTKTVLCEELKSAILDKIKVSKSDRKLAGMRVYKNNWEHAPKPVPIPSTDSLPIYKILTAKSGTVTYAVALNPSLTVETTDEDSLGSSWAADDVSS